MEDNTKKLEFPVVDNFSPEVPVEVHGLTDTTKVVAIVDTGYTGFLSVPLAIGLKANLRLMSVGYYTLADGRKVKKLECIGKIRFGGKDLVGIISLSETSDECLLGMQFLEGINMDFMVSCSQKKAVFSEEVRVEDRIHQSVKKAPKKVENKPAPAKKK